MRMYVLYTSRKMNLGRKKKVNDERSFSLTEMPTLYLSSARESVDELTIF